MKETKHYCDICGKEVWWQSNCARIIVFASQGPNKSKKWKDFMDDYGNTPYWKHREKYDVLLCEDCVGEKITINHGDDHHFSLKDGAITFLKKFGFIKTDKEK